MTIFTCKEPRETNAWLPWKWLSVCLPAANKNTLEMVQYGVEGSSTFLECQARSPHALIKWHLQRDNSDRRKEVSRPVRLPVTPSVRAGSQCHYFPVCSSQLGSFD